MQIHVKINDQIITLLNVYLPYDNGTNLDEFQMYLSKVDSILTNNPHSCATGDYNANIRADSSRFGWKLIQFADESLVISDEVHAPDDSFTYVSDAHVGSVAWLDHVISTRSMHSLIDNIWIDYSYDLPLCMKLNVRKINLAPRDSLSPAQTHVHGPIRWDSLSDKTLEEYKNTVSDNLNKVHLNHSLLLCEDPMCDDPRHRSRSAIDNMYESIVDSLILASEELRGRQRNPLTKLLDGVMYVLNCTVLHVVLFCCG